jgi:hypothetical protein
MGYDLKVYYAGKRKDVLVDAMKVYGGSKSIYPLILNLDTRLK